MSIRADAWRAGGMQPDWTLTVAPSNQDESGRESPLAGVDDRGLVDACLGGGSTPSTSSSNVTSVRCTRCASGSSAGTKTQPT